MFGDGGPASIGELKGPVTVDSQRQDQVWLPAGGTAASGGMAQQTTLLENLTGSQQFTSRCMKGGNLKFSYVLFGVDIH